MYVTFAETTSDKRAVQQDHAIREGSCFQGGKKLLSALNLLRIADILMGLRK